MALLEIENLSVEFPSKTAVMHAVDGVSLTLEAGEVLGIVGESGSGKSVTMMALMGLVSFPGRVSADKLRFDGHDLLKLSGTERNKLIGKDVAMIFQDPTTSLNPCFTVGFQIASYLGPSDSKKDGKKLIVEELTIRDARAQASAAFLNGKTISIPLPDITLKNLGKAKGGISPGELGQEVAGALKAKLTGAVSFDRLMKSTGEVLESAGGKLKGLLK